MVLSVDAEATGRRWHTRLSNLAGTVSARSLLRDAGTLLLCLSGLVPWFAFPLTGRVPGYAFPLWGGDSPERLSRGAFAPFSFGVVAILLGIIIAASARSEAARRRCFRLGGAVLGLACCFPVAVVFRHPMVLQTTAAQSVEHARIARFSRSIQGSNAGLVRRPVTHHPLDLEDRVGLAMERTDLTRVGMGWTWTALAALMIMASAVLGGGAGEGIRFRSDALLLTASFGALMAGISARSLIAETHLARAQEFLAQGFTTRALARAQRALSWDPNLADRESFVRLQGAALYRVGARDEPEARLFVGDNWAAAGDPVQALAYYRDAFAVRPDWIPVRRRISDRLVTAGLTLHDEGNTPSAINRWESALQVAPDRIDAHFFLAYAHFLQSRGDQSRALAESELLLARVRDKLVRADILNLMGDCYQNEGKLVEARSMYRRSLNSIHLVRRVVNANAQAGLQGM